MEWKNGDGHFGAVPEAGTLRPGRGFRTGRAWLEIRPSAIPRGLRTDGQEME